MLVKQTKKMSKKTHEVLGLVAGVVFLLAITYGIVSSLQDAADKTQKAKDADEAKVTGYVDHCLDSFREDYPEYKDYTATLYNGYATPDFIVEIDGEHQYCVVEACKGHETPKIERKNTYQGGDIVIDKCDNIKFSLQATTTFQ